MEPRMSQSAPASNSPPAPLGLWDAVSIIVGIVVGSGIFETPPLILRQVSGPWLALGLWAAGGLLSLLGALCYAELASTYPRCGGDYVYLSRAYAPWVGFLFGWAQMAVILPASIGMMAYVFADYAVRLFGWAPSAGVLCAAGAVAGLTLLNLLGVPFGKGTQNLLSAVKVLGLGGVLATGFFWARHTDWLLHPGFATGATGSPQLHVAFALVLVFLTYGGYNDAAYVAAEVRDGRRNIPRALVLGVLAITALYLLVNAAYLTALGFEGARESHAVAADVLAGPLGAGGRTATCLLVMVSALGAVNGLLFAGARVYTSVGADYSVFAWLWAGHRGCGVPPWALLSPALVSLGLIALVGTDPGRRALAAQATWLGLGSLTWDGTGGFETLLRCTAPVFWLFFLLSALSLFLLRWRDQHRPRVFAVPFYPVVPLLFCATCGYMLYSSINYAAQLGLVGAVLLAAGLPLYAVSGRAAPALEAPGTGTGIARSSMAD
jgi:APA family basic amino acid/polyamine antiporter